MFASILLSTTPTQIHNLYLGQSQSIICNIYANRRWFQWSCLIINYFQRYCNRAPRRSEFIGIGNNVPNHLRNLELVNTDYQTLRVRRYYPLKINVGCHGLNWLRRIAKFYYYKKRKNTCMRIIITIASWSTNLNAEVLNCLCNDRTQPLGHFFDIQNPSYIQNNAT